MGQRRHHYEAAFEAYLREKRLPYVSVNEARKALLPRGAKPELEGVSSGQASCYGVEELHSLEVLQKAEELRVGEEWNGRS